jgi:hypothetical protein
MQTREKRAVEEANLFNPAFCAVLLAKTAEEFKKTQQRLPFRSLPYFASRSPSRDALPGSTVSALLTWVQDHRDQLVNFFGAGSVAAGDHKRSRLRLHTRYAGSASEIISDPLKLLCGQSQHRRLLFNLVSRWMRRNIYQTHGNLTTCCSAERIEAIDGGCSCSQVLKALLSSGK